MNAARTRSASGPSLRMISEISNSAVGHTSGQWVKPKKTRNGRPRKSRSVTVTPSWSISRNGPPMAAVCCTPGTGVRPVTSKTTPKQNTSPAQKAPSTSKRRMLRGLIMEADLDVCSETGHKPGDDHLVKHRRAVMGPQRHRSREQKPARGRHDHERSQRGRRRGGCAIGHRYSKACRGALTYQIGLITYA